MNEFPLDPLEPFVINSSDSCVQGRVSIPEVIPSPTFQPLPDPHHLDGYSHAFFELLCERHPEWRAAFQIGTSGDEKFLYVEVPCSSTHLNPLWISSEDSRITVGFGKVYHAHFATYPPYTDGKMFVRALQFVDDFVEEKLVLLIAMTRELHGCSWVQLKDESITGSQDLSRSTYDRVCVYSWKSTFDREVSI